MRTLGLLLAATAVPLTAAAPGAAGQSPRSPQALSVSLALSLSSVTVRDGQVTYVWLVPKGPPGPAAQDLTSYDKHTARTTLTPAGKAWLMAWTRRYHVFSFAHRYAPAQPRSYGSAFVTRLTIQDGGHTMQSTWDETSHAKAPEAAAGALVAWARQTSGGH